ncbi:unnamed protein product [Urochloa humidicola]
MCHKVRWDEEMQDSIDVHEGLLQQLALGVDDENTKDSAQEVCDEMPDKVVWDEDISGELDMNNDLLQLLASGKGYLDDVQVVDGSTGFIETGLVDADHVFLGEFGVESQPVGKAAMDHELIPERDISFLLGLAMDYVINKMPINVNLHDGLLQQLAGARENVYDLKTEPTVELDFDEILTEFCSSSVDNNIADQALVFLPHLEIDKDTLAVEQFYYKLKVAQQDGNKTCLWPLNKQVQFFSKFKELVEHGMAMHSSKQGSNVIQFVLEEITTRKHGGKDEVLTHAGGFSQFLEFGEITHAKIHQLVAFNPTNQHGQIVSLQLSLALSVMVNKEGNNMWMEEQLEGNTVKMLILIRQHLWKGGGIGRAYLRTVNSHLVLDQLQSGQHGGFSSRNFKQWKQWDPGITRFMDVISEKGEAMPSSLCCLIFYFSLFKSTNRLSIKETLFFTLVLRHQQKRCPKTNEDDLLLVNGIIVHHYKPANVITVRCKQYVNDTVLRYYDDFLPAQILILHRSWAAKIELIGYPRHGVAWGQATFRGGGSVTPILYGLNLWMVGPSCQWVKENYKRKAGQGKGIGKTESEIGSGIPLPRRPRRRPSHVPASSSAATGIYR